MSSIAQDYTGFNSQNGAVGVAAGGSVVAGGGSVGGAPLGIPTISVTPPDPERVTVGGRVLTVDSDGVIDADPRADELAARRVNRYKLQDAARELLPGERVCACCRTIAPNKTSVDVCYSDRVNRAHYKGLMVCGSVWVCPVCASKITERRRQELADALEAHPEYQLVMVTVTLQHERGDALADLADVLNEAWRRVKRGAPWGRIADAFGFVGYVSALEVTWGPAHGWHPHKHVLFLSKLGADELDADALHERLSARFGRMIAKLGGYASSIHGLRVQLADQGGAAYLHKWGLDAELTKAPVKRGRGGYSPFELLALYQEGQGWAGALFVEYAEAFKGRRQLVWSRGLRDLLGVGAELSDEELAELEEEPAEVLVSLTRQQWRVVCQAGARGRLLEVASSGRRLWVWAYLVGLGVPGAEAQLTGGDG